MLSPTNVRLTFKSSLSCATSNMEMRAGMYLFLNLWRSNFPKNKLHIFIFLLVICSVFLFLVFLFISLLEACVDLCTSSNQKSKAHLNFTSWEIIFTNLLLFPEIVFIKNLPRRKLENTEETEERSSCICAAAGRDFSFQSSVDLSQKNNQVNAQLLKSCRSSLQTEDVLILVWDYDKNIWRQSKIWTCMRLNSGQQHVISKYVLVDGEGGEIPASDPSLVPLTGTQVSL